MKELRNTIEALDKKKATRYDNICNEFSKLSTDRILKVISAFLNLALTKGLITSNWCLDIISPIHKEELKSNPNYRGICVMNSLLKVMCTLMYDRLNEYCEQTSLTNIGQMGLKKK